MTSLLRHAPRLPETLDPAGGKTKGLGMSLPTGRGVRIGDPWTAAAGSFTGMRWRQGLGKGSTSASSGSAAVNPVTTSLPLTAWERTAFLYRRGARSYPARNRRRTPAVHALPKQPSRPVDRTSLGGFDRYPGRLLIFVVFRRARR